MMYMAKMQTVSEVAGKQTVRWEEFPLCSLCLDAVEPEFTQPILSNNICVRCGIKNFEYREEAK